MKRELVSKQKDNVRLKLYIPIEKYKEWEYFLNHKDPQSDFFTNFSNWVRLNLKYIPKLDDKFLFYPIELNNFRKQSEIINSKSIEKTIWISSNVKNALTLSRGHFTLNSFVLLLLDHALFSITRDNAKASVIEMDKRIKTIENRLQTLIEREKTHFT